VSDEVRPTDAGAKPSTASPTEQRVDDDRPATFREILGVAEYRALFGATALSWVGDYFAKVAITVLIFQDTDSVLLSAAAFAISYLPWIVGGPVLAAIAERYPYRRVMIICDLVRMVLVGSLAIPGIRLPALLVILFAASLLTPPFQAARSALLPRLLTGDRYVVGLALQNIVSQASQVIGYAVGGTVSALNPRIGLLINSTTFALSALLLWRGVRHRPAVMPDTQRNGLLRETRDGFNVVFSHPVMRPIALVVFLNVAILILPEGLAAGWADELGGGARATGLLMAANPIGYTIGGLVIGRMMAPSTRLKLVKPLLIASPLLLVPALLQPGFGVVFALILLSGFTGMVTMPLNGLFVQVLPSAYRARAFGIMQGGMQISHAVAVLSAGALAQAVGSVPTVVGVWALVGLGLMLLATMTWPSREVIDTEIARTRALNEAFEAERSEAGPSDTDETTTDETQDRSPAAEAGSQAPREHRSYQLDTSRQDTAENPTRSDNEPPAHSLSGATHAEQVNDA